jgi:prevent-host-death family protein
MPGVAVEVGIRELRADLSRWLRRVREGEEIVVTDRGKAVARITGPNGRSKLEELIAAGIVTPAPRKSRAPRPRPIEAKGTVSDLVAEQRR